MLTAMLLAFPSVFAQQHKEYPIKKVNGIEFYQYTVQSSEGLFAVGRKFEISPDEIAKANPEIKNGLKVGQQLLIPVQHAKFIQTIGKTPQVTKENKPKISFIEHKVEKKQTLFGISNKYSVSQEDIKKYNPEIETGFKEGMILKIPVLSKESVEVAEQKPLQQVEQQKEVTQVEKPAKAEVKPIKSEKKNGITHIVEEGETLYSISRKYKVEVSDIVALNKESAEKLSVGTELKIPVKNGAATVQKKDSLANKTKQVFDINKLFDISILAKPEDNKKLIRIAFLLPFMLDQDKKDVSVERFVEFYAGALLAIKEGKQKGVSFEIYTYDTEKSEEKLNEVLANSELKTMDLIIGPAFTNQVSLIGDFAKENRINTLIPFSSKVSDIDNNSYLFQFNPGTETQLDFATEVFTEKYKNMNIIFADIPGMSSMDEGKTWADDLRKALRKANRHYSTMELTTSDAADFSTIMRTGDKNLVIFNTDKYAYVSPFLTPLRAVSSDYNVVLFEQYSWINQANKLPIGMYFSPFISSINQDKLSIYNKDYTHYFGKLASKESPRFDLLGYDLSSYFISLFQKFGRKYTDKIGTYNFTDGLQSRPMFERVSNGSGFINQRVYLIED